MFSVNKLVDQAGCAVQIYEHSHNDVNGEFAHAGKWWAECVSRLRGRFQQIHLISSDSNLHNLLLAQMMRQLEDEDEDEASCTIKAYPSMDAGVSAFNGASDDDMMESAWSHLRRMENGDTSVSSDFNGRLLLLIHWQSTDESEDVWNRPKLRDLLFAAHRNNQCVWITSAVNEPLHTDQVPRDQFMRHWICSDKVMHHWRQQQQQQNQPQQNNVRFLYLPLSIGDERSYVYTSADNVWTDGTLVDDIVTTQEQRHNEFNQLSTTVISDVIMISSDDFNDDDDVGVDSNTVGQLISSATTTTARQQHELFGTMNRLAQLLHTLDDIRPRLRQLTAVTDDTEVLRHVRTTRSVPINNDNAINNNIQSQSGIANTMTNISMNMNDNINDDNSILPASFQQGPFQSRPFQSGVNICSKRDYILQENSFIQATLLLLEGQLKQSTETQETTSVENANCVSSSSSPTSSSLAGCGLCTSTVWKQAHHPYVLSCGHTGCLFCLTAHARVANEVMQRVLCNLDWEPLSEITRPIDRSAITPVFRCPWCNSGIDRVIRLYATQDEVSE